MRVYVCAPYADAPLVRDLHDRLRSLGHDPTSTWAEHAAGAEDHSLHTAEDLARVAAANDHQLVTSDAVIVLARPAVGAEMYCEARLAIAFDLPVLWIGRRCLSAWRPGVRRLEDLDEALTILAAATSAAEVLAA